MQQQDYDYLFKFLLVGNSSVGKSSILLRFSDSVFNDNFLPTIGVDFKIRTFELNGQTIKTQIWDTAGQERFKTITSSYYKGAQGVILVYDITDAQSFKDIENWLSEVDKHASSSIIKLLVGNKSDLVQKRQVSFEQGKQYADSQNMQFLETSAKENINIELSFEQLALQIRQRIINNQEDENKNNNNSSRQRSRLNAGICQENKKKSSKCC